jgi:quercetin dioxygenase-like cupin family protein
MLRSSAVAIPRRRLRRVIARLAYRPRRAACADAAPSTFVEEDRSMIRMLALLVPLTLLLALFVPGHAAAQTAPVTKHLSRFDVPNPPAQFDQVLLVVDFPPGTWTPPHTHGGPVFITVAEGEVSARMAGMPATEKKYRVGKSFVETPGEFMEVGNAGTAKVRLISTVVLPKGAALTTNQQGVSSQNIPPGPTTVYRATLDVQSRPTPLEVAHFVVEFPVSSWTAWHTHGGPGFVLVTDGEVTLDRGAAQERFRREQTWQDSADMVHRAGNVTAAPAAVFASFLLPKGATLTTAQPGQTGVSPGAAAPAPAAPAAPARTAPTQLPRTPTQLPRTGAPDSVALLIVSAGLGAAGWLVRRRAIS